MIYMMFILAACITIYSAVKLSTFADVIGERTKLGGMMAGTFLLAGATSLPEVTTSLTAIGLNNPDLAISNVFGSNLFNLFVLAVFDLIYRRKKMFSLVGGDHLMTGYMNFGLTGIVFTAMLFPSPVHFLNIGIEMYLLVLLYVICMKLMSARSAGLVTSHETAAASESDIHHTGAISLRRAKTGFVIHAVIILGAGSLLTFAGDAIALATGLSSSFMGTYLIAGATSLPEVVTVLVALQLANYQLAVGNILGSNMFNLLILALSDAAFRQGPVLSAVSPVTLVSITSLMIINIVVVAALLIFKYKSAKTGTYTVPSVVVIVLYVICSYIIFTMS